MAGLRVEFRFYELIHALDVFVNTWAAHNVVFCHRRLFSAEFLFCFSLTDFDLNILLCNKKPLSFFLWALLLLNPLPSHVSKAKLVKKKKVIKKSRLFLAYFEAKCSLVPYVCTLLMF